MRWMKVTVGASVAAATLMMALGGGTVVWKLAVAEPPAASAASASESPLDTLKPGEWYEAPDSKLSGSGVWPPRPTPPGNPTAVIKSWSGGAYDTKRDRLILHGGGHGDYAGNELYAFDVKTFKWSRPWGPSKEFPNIAIQPNGLDVYSDGNPPSVHTYDGMVYLPVQDKLWRGGGSLWSGSGRGTRACWLFDFDTLKWERKADSPTLGVGVFARYDPVTGHVFAASDRSILQEYDPSADTWVEPVRTVMDRGEETTGAIDPEHRLFVGIGNGKLNIYNIKTRTITNRRKTTGGDAIVNARGPGLAYDPVIKRIVGWSGGTSAYSLDISTWSWTEHKAEKTNSVTPTAPTRVGVFGRFQYIPSKNVYILVNDVDQNVLFYKLSAATRQ
jgi:hypothetical protein